jgi:uncharacterized cupredoxin-like copper-binding protein
MKRGIATGLLALGLFAALSPAVGAAARVSVKAKEFKYILSTKTVHKGKVTFTIKNTGHLKHDLKIAGHKSKLLKPGASTTLTVTFSKAGKYHFLCTVPGHAAAGMKGTLTVR